MEFWIREEFNLNELEYAVKPKGALLINETKTNTQNNEIENNLYAISFGYAFHTLKKYSDKNWPMQFAEHITLNKVKSMTILSPNAVINRRINNYVNFREVLLNSGEALNQLNGYLDLGDEEEDFKERISISNSIIFEVDEPSLDSLAKIIDYITFVNNIETVVNPIPYFKEVKNIAEKDALNQKLTENILIDIENNEENPCIDICDFIVIDTFPKFLYQFENFKLKYSRISKDISLLTIPEIYKFINDNLDEIEDILEIKVLFIDNETGDSKEIKLKNLIIYDSPTDVYLFEEGIWWTYNGKYIQDLKDSIDDLEVIYEEKFDFDEEEYLTYVRQKAVEEGINFDENPKKCKRKWYKERVFNLLREDDGFICNDRNKDYIENSEIEVADLFKLDEKSMFSVKIGSSSNLNYVVDQSLLALKMIDNGEIREIENEEIDELNKENIKDVYLWLILTRKKQIAY